MQYKPISATPSIQVASPSFTISADVSVLRRRAAMSNGGKTSVSAPPPNANEYSTRIGMTTSAISSELLRTMLIAYCGRFLAARRIPATFSTALPAIATTTIPANASEMCSARIAGSSASTNQSETTAAPTDAHVSVATASDIDHSGSTAVTFTWRADRSGSEPSENGRLATKTASNNSEHATLRDFSC